MMILAVVPMVAFLVVGAFVSGPNDKTEAHRRRGLIRKVQLEQGYRPCGK